MDIYGYARLSRATEESTSIARQRQIIEQTTTARGDNLLGIFEDEDVSALKKPLMQRPGLVKAIAAAEEHGSAALMVWRLDRIARSVGEFMRIVDRDIEVVSATEPIDTTTPMGRAMAQVLQVFAELEARTIGLRAQASYAYLRQNGRWTGGNVPYGYRPVPHPGGAGAALDIDPDEAAVVRRVADTILKDRRTLNSVVAELNAEGVKPRRAARWTLRSLQGILLSPASLGRIAYQGDVVRDDRGLPVQAWPPVLAPEEQLMLRPLITGNPRKPRRRAARLLSGLALCDSCGGTLSVRSYSGGASYGCTADARGRVCEAPVYVKAELIEAEVERRFLATYGFFKMTEEIETAPDDPGLVVVEEAIRDTASALAKPGVDVAALAARMADLHAERERLAAAPKRRESLLVESDRTFAEEWEGASIERRRALLRSSGAEIRVLRPVGGRRWTPERVVMRFS